MKTNQRPLSMALALACFAILTGLAGTASAQSDPGVPGPLAVERAEYDFGDNAFQFEGRPTEIRAVTYYPVDLSGGPFPLVVFLHGWHPTCYLGSLSYLEWPCTPPRQQIPSYQGYEYEQEILASWGYIVVSISAAGVNARDTQFLDIGMLWRAQLLQYHLDLWNQLNTTGGDPFGTMFVNKVDLTRVGTMGHSRGGEGVSRHYTYNRELGSPYGLQAVLPLAPVNFSREVLDNVNIQVLLPWCDGDVSNLQGAHYYDDSRYTPADPTNKHYTLVMGGNHAFYNTIWTPGGWPAATWDDWQAFQDPSQRDPWCGAGPGNHKLSPERVRGTFKAYGTGFFRLYLGGETEFLPLFKGDVPPPPSATTDEIYSTYHAKDAIGARLDVNRLLDDSYRFTNELGGAVSQTGLTEYDLCGGPEPQPRHCLPDSQSTNRQPHTTPSRVDVDHRGLSQLRFGWDDTTGAWVNEIPVGLGDVSAYAVIQFRASVNFTDSRNDPLSPQDLAVTLTDASGNSASSAISSASGALFYPPGEVTVIPKIVLNTIRVPLANFTGVDLTSVTRVSLEFNQITQGALLLSDLAFAD